MVKCEEYSDDDGAITLEKRSVTEKLRAAVVRDNHMKTSFHIAVLPGDGIGIDVTEEAVRVLRAIERSFSAFTLRMTTHESGAICYQRTGDDLPAATVAACRAADAVLLGAMGHPDIRKPDGTELTPQVTLRVLRDL